jgi:hypothetical protein
LPAFDLLSGSGLDDLIVGSIEASPSGKSRAGKSYVIFGKIDNTVINIACGGDWKATLIVRILTINNNPPYHWQ